MRRAHNCGIMLTHVSETHLQCKHIVLSSPRQVLAVVPTNNRVREWHQFSYTLVKNPKDPAGPMTNPKTGSVLSKIILQAFKCEQELSIVINLWLYSPWNSIIFHHTQSDSCYLSVKSSPPIRAPSTTPPPLCLPETISYLRISAVA